MPARFRTHGDKQARDSDRPLCLSFVQGGRRRAGWPDARTHRNANAAESLRVGRTALRDGAALSTYPAVVTTMPAGALAPLIKLWFTAVPLSLARPIVVPVPARVPKLDQ
jgi:hypothetical protein